MTTKRNKVKIGTIGLLGAGLVGGGILAASLANVTASGFAVGQATLEANCLNPATASVFIGSDPTYLDGDWRVTGVLMNISDATNTIECNGVAFKVTAVDANGDELQTVSGTIAQSGAGISQQVAFDPVLLASDVERYGVSILG